jgi:ABC-type Fe3+/spermidine/putrescine transport system ATPase subunit
MLELRSILARAAEIEGQRAVTTVYVTHDQEEAFAVAGRILVMNGGRIEQTGRPLELYRSPGTPFVARFLGMGNLIPGMVKSERPYLVETAVGLIEIEDDCQIGSEGLLLIRPEAAEILDSEQAGRQGVNGRVIEVSFRGRYQIVQVEIVKDGRVTNLKLTFDIAQILPAAGESVNLVLLPEKCHFYSEPDF